MASSPEKPANESDAKSAAEETLDFDDDTLKGELKHVFYFPWMLMSMKRYKKLRPSLSISTVQSL